MSHSILDTIDRFWEARIAGDKAAVQSFLAPEAVYELVGAAAIADRAVVGPAPAGPAADRLMDDFKFHSVERITSVVEGLKAAVVSKFQVSFRGGAPVIAEACDIWEFDTAGKATSVKQFIDTDLVRRVMTSGSSAPAGGPS